MSINSNVLRIFRQNRPEKIRHRHSCIIFHSLKDKEKWRDMFNDQYYIGTNTIILKLHDMMGCPSPLVDHDVPPVYAEYNSLQ